MTMAVIILALLLYYTAGQRFQSSTLIALSLYVYWIVSPAGVAVIGTGALVAAAGAYTLEHRSSRWVLITPMILLAAGFILLRNHTAGMALPIGYSVLTFTAISLLVDQWRTPRHYRPDHLLAYLLFIPKIFAGPIVRAGRFITPEGKRWHGRKIYEGVKYLIFASFCKLVVADMLTSVHSYGSGVTLWLQVFCHSISFFFDFWAYSLMAIGAGLLFGYRLPVNFRRPYFTTSLRDFWHRWNITLGTWLRDYIYIPLGGSRKGRWRYVIAVWIVFMASALWHGSTLPFLLWGASHAALMCVEHFAIHPQTRAGRLTYAIFIFVAVSLLWQLFIVDTGAEVLARIRALAEMSASPPEHFVRLAAAVGALLVLTHPRVTRLVTRQSSRPLTVVAEVAMLSAMVATLLLLHAPLSFQFFYFRF